MEEIYMQRLKLQEERGETPDDVVIVNPEMQQVFRLAKKLGNFNTNVLLTGESGVCLLYTFRAHETRHDLVCRLLLEKKKKKKKKKKKRKKKKQNINTAIIK